MRTTQRSGFVVLGATAVVTFVVVACGSRSGSTFDDPSGGNPGGGGPGGSFGDPNVKPDGGDTLANDPPPSYCGPNPQSAPPKPGGTVECPDDKNKPGCGCSTLGQEAACWTGLRANRNLGICKDGVTKCVQRDENAKVWGPCEGQVLPVEGQTKGAQACKCFSIGKWALKNLTVCFRSQCSVDPGGGSCPEDKLVSFNATSTIDDGSGNPPKCGVNNPTEPPSPTWTTDTLTADCAGKFTLCYELKAGDFANPQKGDCSLVKQCVEGEYVTANAEQPFPPLPGWSSPNQACAKKWSAEGGYGEMTVVGTSVLCDKIQDPTGGSFVFNRVKYCPSLCNDPANKDKPECQNCFQGGGGQF